MMAAGRSGERVAVVGLGAIGSFTLKELASRGFQSRGFEQFSPGHDRGASGGRTRIFRLLYGEGTEYVPLLRRARELWLDHERWLGRQVLYPNGVLTIGTERSPWLQAVLDSAAVEDLEHRVLTHDELAALLPIARLAPEEVAVLDPSGGLLATHRAIVGAVGRAEDAGAAVSSHTEVTAITEGDDSVVVETSSGSYDFDQVVVTTGPWINRLLPHSGVTTIGVRQSFHVLTARGVDAAGLPSVMRRSDGQPSWALQPDPNGAEVKIFVESSHAPARDDAAVGSRALTDDWIRSVEDSIPGLFTGVAATVIGGAEYPEGWTSDEHPVIGRLHPGSRIVIAAGMSGHGFKLAPAYAELISSEVDRSIDLDSAWPQFRHRFAAGVPS